MKKYSFSFLVFVIIEIACGFYFLFSSLYSGYLEEMPSLFKIDSLILYIFSSLLGITFVLLGFGLLMLKNWIRISNITFSVVILCLHVPLIFAPLLIFCDEPLIGVGYFFAPTLFNIIAIFFLLREEVKEQFKK